MISRSVLHALYRVADYPLLAELARRCTTAVLLDGRACEHVYATGLQPDHWKSVAAHEAAFLRELGFEPPAGYKSDAHNRQ